MITSNSRRKYTLRSVRQAPIVMSYCASMLTVLIGNNFGLPLLS